MKTYDAYIETNVASLPKIPAHWELKRLKHIVKMHYGDALSTEIREKGETEVFGSNGPVGKHNTANTDSPVIIVGRKGSYGKLNFSKIPVFCIDTAYHVSQKDSGADLRFIYYAMHPLRLDTLSQDTGVPGLSREIAYNLPVPLPPVDEQLAIAAYLDSETTRIDELIVSKNELRALLEGHATSIFASEISTLAARWVGDSESPLQWLPSVPNHWRRCKMKHIIESLDQGVSPQCESRPPEVDEWGVLKVGCINTGALNPAESKALPPEITPLPEVTVCAGDLIVSRANTKALVGRSAVAKCDHPRLMLSDKLYRLKLNTGDCLPEFVRQMMWIPAVRDRIEERATGASPSMLNIDRRTITEIDLVLPPLEEQRQILTFVEKQTTAIKALIEHIDCEIDMLKELRSATITDAVLGRIDVRNMPAH